MAKPVLSGDGVLKFLGFTGDVGYEVVGSPKPAPNGARTARGWIDASVDDARAAFRAGHATLQLEDQRNLVVTMTAHSEGSGRTYFEVTG